MKVSNLTVGPIVGWTRPRQVRLWGRGALATSGRCLAVVEVRRADGTGAPIRKAAQLSSSYDYTGIIDIEGLEPATKYNYQLGFVDSATPADMTAIDMTAFDMTDVTLQSFRTAAERTAAETSLLLGSCRMAEVFRPGGDTAFRSAAALVERSPVDFLMMAGDQVYLDYLPHAASALEAYRDAFTHKGIRALMARTPTYMILDDHEITNDWHQTRLGPWDEDGKRRNPADVVADNNRYLRAMAAYNSYQLLYSPAFVVGEQPKVRYYNFESGPADVFVLDVRTERIYNNIGPPKPQMISDVQLKKLLAWLDTEPSRIKLIVTSVQMFPNVDGKGHDTWQYDKFGYQRRAILGHIADNPQLKVCFLQGDVHSSMAAMLELGDGRKIYSVTASPWAWPFTSVDWHFNFEPIETHTGGTWPVWRRGQVHTAESFARVDVDATRIKVQFYDRDGRSLEDAITLPF